MVRPLVTDQITRIYFFPALTAKIIGAIALGFVYQFYYNGGDTFAYHTHGSREVWHAFCESPSLGLRLLFSNGKFEPDFYYYSESIWFFRDQSAFAIVRIAALFDLLTFSSYSGTAALFAVLSFTGGWMLFQTFYKIQPALHIWTALSVFFIPSCIFWGSGILKDTVTLAFLGMGTYSFYETLILRKLHLGYILLFILSVFIIFSIKKYILISFLLAAVIWVFFQYFSLVKSIILKILLLPIIAIFCIFSGYALVNEIVSDDSKYALNNLAKTAQVTAYDIHYWTGKDAGSGYTLGELDGTFGGLVKLAPQAINVSLYRPYFWEVRNPLMLLSAIESFVILMITVFVLLNVRAKTFIYLQIPEIAFCMTFALIFAFGVGVSTYNFGSLVRYKIPLEPFYMLAIGFLYFNWKQKAVEDELKTNY
jgi:hypothetical protein